jgi:hypothetical protein
VHQCQVQIQILINSTSKNWCQKKARQRNMLLKTNSGKKIRKIGKKEVGVVLGLADRLSVGWLGD